MPDRRPLSREFRVEQHIRCNDGQMVRNIRDTCSLVTVDLSGAGRSGVDPTHEAQAVTVSLGTQETPVVGREYERVCRRTTGQTLAKAVAGDPRTDSRLDTDIDVRVTNQPWSLWLKAGANSLASRAQETSSECMDVNPAASHECGKATRSTKTRHC